MKPARRQRQDQGIAPFNELSRVRSAINRIFEDPFSAFAPNMGFAEGWAPSADIIESKDMFTVKAELPGMRKDDIQVSIHNNTLTISGERKEEKDVSEGEYYHSECSYGRFQRSIELPQAVDPEKISANYKDGILTVTLQKTEDAKRKQIEVKSS